MGGAGRRGDERKRAGRGGEERRESGDGGETLMNWVVGRGGKMGRVDEVDEARAAAPCGRVVLQVLAGLAEC